MAMKYFDQTTHFRIYYDDELDKDHDRGYHLAAAIQSNLENDYTVLSAWFGGIDAAVPSDKQMTVALENATGGAHWDPTAGVPTLEIGVMADADSMFGPQAVRELVNAELSEVFMRTQGGDWEIDTRTYFLGIPISGTMDEGSRGEGLSDFLKVECLIANGIPDAKPAEGLEVTRFWLNSSRPDFVSYNPDNHDNLVVNGCTTLFLYYLHYQLKKSIRDIIATGAHTGELVWVPPTGSGTAGHLQWIPPSLARLYTKLTGRTDAWDSFKNLVDLHFPPSLSSVAYNPLGDNLFPVPELAEFGVPAQGAPGDMAKAWVALDRPAPAEVTIQLRSSSPLVQFYVDGSGSGPTTYVTLAPGSLWKSIGLSIADVPDALLPITVTLRAEYAGNPLESTLLLAPARVVGIELSGDVLVAGEYLSGTVTLNHGAHVTIRLESSDKIAKFDPSSDSGDSIDLPVTGKFALFTIYTKPVGTPFKPYPVRISAYYRDSFATATFTLKPNMVVGVLKSLELTSATIKGGGSLFGVVTLEEGVPVDTIVSLSAFDTSGGPGIPGGDGGSDLVTIPSTVTVPAGSGRAEFPIHTATLAPTIRRTVTIWASSLATKYAKLTITGESRAVGVTAP